MTTMQRSSGKSRKGRFDSRRRRRVNLGGPYIGNQAKLIGSHGGKSLELERANQEKIRRLRKIAKAELKEEILRLELDDESSAYLEIEDEEEKDQIYYILGESCYDDYDYDYNVFDYSDF